jgi:hypothetical protein
MSTKLFFARAPMPSPLLSRTVLAVLVAGLQGCAVVSVAGAAAGASISVAGAVVSTSVSLAGKVAGKAVDLALPDGDTAEP